MDQASPHPDFPDFPDFPAAGHPARPGRPARPQRPERQDPGPRQPGRPRLVYPVIVGYDGSPSARNALAYAAGMARRLRRPLLVVHVISSRVYCNPLTGMITPPRDVRALERWLLDELDQVADRTGLDVHVRTRRGIPAAELAVTAAEVAADALVIGAPRHLWHRLAGSVPAWLSRHASCPVITVP